MRNFIFKGGHFDGDVIPTTGIPYWNVIIPEDKPLCLCRHSGTEVAKPLSVRYQTYRMVQDARGKVYYEYVGG